MEQLQPSDVQGLREFLRALYALDDHEAFVRGMLCALRKLIPGEFAGFMVFDPAQPGAEGWCDPPEVSTPEFFRKWNAHVRMHPLVFLFQQTHESQAYTMSNWLTQEQFHALPWYHEVYKPMGWEDGLAFVASAGDPLVLGLCVLRSTWDAFSEREILLMNLLRPHVVQARENVLAVMRLQAGSPRSAEALGLDREVIVLSAAGRVREASPRAWELLSTYAGPWALRDDRLPERIERWVLAQEAVLNASGDFSEVPQPLVFERDEGCLVLRFFARSGTRGLLFEERHTRLVPTAMQSLGLTPREAEVLRWVAEGKTNAEIGIILNLSARTVDKHVERIREKLKVETRTAAAAVALRLVSGDEG